MLKTLQNIQENLINKVADYTIIRKQIKELSVSKRLIVLIGNTGVGKTSLLAQFASELSPEQCLLFNGSSELSLDIGIENILKEFYETGGKIAIIDDIYKYPKWHETIQKSLNKFKDLQIIISGPFSINGILNKTKINKGHIHKVLLPELSFRLYLIFKYHLNFEQLSLNDILDNSEILSVNIASDLKDLANDFQEYLDYGCYPFNNSLHDNEHVYTLVKSIINEDIPAIHKIKFENLSIFKRLIFKLLSHNGILKVNVDKIAKEFNISEPTFYTYLDIIENTGIFRPIKNHMSIDSRKPDRIFFYNPNILNIYSKFYNKNVDWYVLKKTFFIHCFNEIYYINEKKLKIKNFIFNFFEEERFTFFISDEIIPEEPTHIPLWLFGFLK